MPKRSTSGATACWFLASAGLAGAIVLQIQHETSLTFPITAAPAEASLIEEEQAIDLALGDLSTDALDMIVERPLFSRSRRPFAPTIAAAPVQQPRPPRQELSAKLKGVMLSGDAKLALMSHPQQGLLRLRQGQDVDGWHIEDIREQEVLLVRGDDVARLRLQKGASSDAEPSAAPTAINEAATPARRL